MASSTISQPLFTQPFSCPLPPVLVQSSWLRMLRVERMSADTQLAQTGAPVCHWQAMLGSKIHVKSQSRTQRHTPSTWGLRNTLGTCAEPSSGPLQCGIHHFEALHPQLLSVVEVD